MRARTRACNNFKISIRNKCGLAIGPQIEASHSTIDFTVHFDSKHSESSDLCKNTRACSDPWLKITTR